MNVNGTVKLLNIVEDGKILKGKVYFANNIGTKEEPIKTLAVETTIKKPPLKPHYLQELKHPYGFELVLQENVLMAQQRELVLVQLYASF